MIKAVIFDLDDTLYIEGDFFQSGFTCVASILQTRGLGGAIDLCSMLKTIHCSEGRERVLNKLADRLGFPEAWVPELIDVFRAHTPVIALAPDVAPVLERLRGRYKLGCITDGWADVQRRKLQALGVEALLDAVVVADDHGRAHWKPSAFPFQSCCTLLGVTTREAVHVGDNPERDMRGARNAGMVSIRIRREGAYFRDVLGAQDGADFEIASLAELEPILAQLA